MKLSVLMCASIVGLVGCGASEAEYCALRAETTRIAAEALSGQLNGTISASKAEAMMATAQANAEKLSQMAKSMGREPKCK